MKKRLHVFDAYIKYATPHINEIVRSLNNRGVPFTMDAPVYLNMNGGQEGQIERGPFRFEVSVDCEGAHKHAEASLTVTLAIIRPCGGKPRGDWAQVTQVQYDLVSQAWDVTGCAEKIRRFSPALDGRAFQLFKKFQRLQERDGAREERAVHLIQDMSEFISLIPAQ